MVASMRWTVADLDLLPETWEDRRYEIIDGELHMSTQPDWRHQLVATDIWEALNRWSRRARIGLAIFAPGVVFSPDNAVAPDVVWVGRDRFREVLRRDGKLHSAPDLIVELLSPGTKNVRRDREAKLDLYSRWGVREYWIVDWPTCSIEGYRRQQAQLRLVGTLYADDTLQSPFLPGFRSTVGELVAQIPDDIGDAPMSERDGDGA